MFRITYTFYVSNNVAEQLIINILTRKLERENENCRSDVSEKNKILN